MNSKECFENDAELCFYLDSEMGQVRRVVLESHIKVCGQCQNQLLIWKQLKSLVHNSLSDVKAPVYLRDRIASVIKASNGRESAEAWTGPRIRVTSDLQPSRDRVPHPDIIVAPGLPVSVAKSEPVGSQMHKPHQHVDGH